MGSRGNKSHQSLRQVVNQQPIGLNMTFPQSLVVANKFVLPTSRWQRQVGNKQIDNLSKFPQLRPTLFHALEIALEAA